MCVQYRRKTLTELFLSAIIKTLIDEFSSGVLQLNIHRLVKNTVASLYNLNCPSCYKPPSKHYATYSYCNCYIYKFSKNQFY